MDLKVVTNKDQSNNIHNISHFDKDYGQVVSRKEQYWCFLGGTPRIFTFSMFYVKNPCKQWPIKIKEDSGHFLGYPINIVASFAEK